MFPESGNYWINRQRAVFLQVTVLLGDAERFTPESRHVQFLVGAGTGRAPLGVSYFDSDAHPA